PQKTGFFDKIFGEKTDSMINNIDRNLMICRFVRPLIEKKRLAFICPPFSEKEKGFPMILQKAFRIAQEFSLPINLYAEEKTYEAIQAIMKDLKVSGKVNFKPFTYWEDFLVITKELAPNDLIIFTASRRGSISYSPSLERIPSKFERYLNQNDLIVVYPQEHSGGISIDDYENFSSVPLSKGIETIEQIGKGIGNIFKKGKE